MTMRQLVSAIIRSRNRRNQSMSFHAALRGIKLDIPAIEKSLDSRAQFSAEEEALLEQRMSEAQARKQAEMRAPRA